MTSAKALSAVMNTAKRTNSATYPAGRVTGFDAQFEAALRIAQMRTPTAKPVRMTGHCSTQGPGSSPSAIDIKPTINATGSGCNGHGPKNRHQGGESDAVTFVIITDEFEVGEDGSNPQIIVLICLRDEYSIGLGEVLANGLLSHRQSPGDLGGLDS